MNKILTMMFGLFILCWVGCQKASMEPVLHNPNEVNIHYSGRIDFSDPSKPRLSGSGSYIRVKFYGTSCSVDLCNENKDGGYGYISTIIDGDYQGRTRVEHEPVTVDIVQDLAAGEHQLIICKDTEAQNGYLEFTGMRCGTLLPVTDLPAHKIEFIGNSITCGMGLDTEDIPCDQQQTWLDEHSAWLAYGPSTARQLDADWLLSSYSGIGLVRFWNKEGPTMGQFYDYLYLNPADSVKWDFSRYVPDLVSICLGTNDFSDGDGSYDRAPLDSAKYVNAYIKFIKGIRGNYPDAQICCLSSPMLTGEKDARIQRFLTAIVDHMRKVEGDAKVDKFFLAPGVYTHGCGNHPDLADHQKMTDQLVPFFKELMGW